MVVGGFPPFTDGEEMKTLMKPLLLSWGADVIEERFPSVGTTCKILMSTPDSMWGRIHAYKADENMKLEIEGKEVWMNVDLSFAERKSSRKVCIVRDILKPLGPNETLKPRFSSCEILRTTAGQDKGVLCKVDVQANLIVWEALADKILNATQKTQVEAQFKQQSSVM